MSYVNPPTGICFMQGFLDVMLLLKRSTPVGAILDFLGLVRMYTYYRTWGTMVVVECECVCMCVVLVAVGIVPDIP